MSYTLQINGATVVTDTLEEVTALLHKFRPPPRMPVPADAPVVPELQESPTAYRCGRCGEPGHNARRPHAEDGTLIVPPKKEPKPKAAPKPEKVAKPRKLGRGWIYKKNTRYAFELYFGKRRNHRGSFDTREQAEAAQEETYQARLRGEPPPEYSTSTKHCSMCHELGHSRVRCKARPTGSGGVDGAVASEAADASTAAPVPGESARESTLVTPPPPFNAPLIPPGALSRRGTSMKYPQHLSRLEMENAVEYPDVDRPVTREDCKSMPRPCPFVSCRHHLYLDVNPGTETIKLNFPGMELWEMPETCSLDVADRGGITLEETGAMINLTRERVRQIETDGLGHIKEFAGNELGLPPDR